jgi:hypothetical protein
VGAVNESYEAAKADPATVDRALKAGYLWKPSPLSRRWVFRNDLEGRTFPDDAVFMSVYRPVAKP